MIFLLSVLLWLFEASVLSILWGWFVVPLGVRPISPAMAFGLNVLINLFIVTHQYVPEEEREEHAKNALVFMLTRILMCYVFGWLAHLWMAR